MGPLPTVLGSAPSKRTTTPRQGCRIRIDSPSVFCGYDICNFALRTFPFTRNVAWEFYEPWEVLAHDYNGLEMSPAAMSLRQLLICTAMAMTLICSTPQTLVQPKELSSLPGLTTYLQADGLAAADPSAGLQNTALDCVASTSSGRRYRFQRAWCTHW